MKSRTLEGSVTSTVPTDLLLLVKRAHAAFMSLVKLPVRGRLALMTAATWAKYVAPQAWLEHADGSLSFFWARSMAVKRACKSAISLLATGPSPVWTAWVIEFAATPVGSSNKPELLSRSTAV